MSEISAADEDASAGASAVPYGDAYFQIRTNRCLSCGPAGLPAIDGGIGPGGPERPLVTLDPSQVPDVAENARALIQHRSRGGRRRR